MADSVTSLEDTLRQRASATVVIILGTAVTVAGYVASNYIGLLLVGLAVTSVGISWRLEVRRRTRIANGAQAIRALWTLTRCIPDHRLVVDPVTRRVFGAHRRPGLLNLFVLRYPDEPGDESDVLITHYLVGAFGRPHSPPLVRHEETMSEDPTTPAPARTMSRNEARDLLAFGDATGVLAADIEEIRSLTAELTRALAV
ncbi:hypothetical protein [Actinocrispum sp. NPDC049592]|uniref:hypothetical protein n=1 Tax=Actinocrispum sp. NPDC049592 TaxID=3154835 RepID=UPI0034243DDF